MTTPTQPEPKWAYFHLKNFNFFLYGTMAILFPYLPLYFQLQGFSKVQVGLLMSVGPIISLFANPFWGYWSDRLQNTRFILILMLSGNLLLGQLFFQMNSFVTVVLFLFIFLFFQTALFPITDSLILHSIDKTRFRFGYFRLWGSVGFSVLALASGPLMEKVGVERLGWVYGAIVLLTIGISIGLPKQGASAHRFTTQGLTQVLTNRYFVAFLLSGLLVAIPNVMNTTFISIYVSELGGSKVDIGWAFFLAAIGEIPVFLLLDRFFKRTPRVMILLLIVSSLLYALRWVLMGIAVYPYQIGLIQILHSVTFGIYFYTATQFCAFLIPDTYRAAGQSVYAMTWMGLAGVIAGLAGGWVFETMGPRTMYGLSTAMSLIGVCGFALMWRRLGGMERGVKC